MLRSLRCCLNPKILAGLALAGLVLFLVTPAGGIAALPLLVTLVCPLSMGLMAWQMRNRGTPAAPVPPAGEGGPAAAEELAVRRARATLAARDDQPRA